jgi:hypothetical protein
MAYAATTPAAIKLKPPARKKVTSAQPGIQTGAQQEVWLPPLFDWAPSETETPPFADHGREVTRSYDRLGSSSVCRAGLGKAGLLWEDELHGLDLSYQLSRTR